MPLTTSSTNEQKVPITLSPTTASGGRAEIESGSLKVSATSGDGTVEMTSDTSFYVVSGDSPGTTEYLVEADADLGEGVVTISDTVTYNVGGAMAENVGLSAGPPEPK